MAKIELVVEHRFFQNMRKSNWTISPKVLGKGTNSCGLFSCHQGAEE